MSLMTILRRSALAATLVLSPLVLAQAANPPGFACATAHPLATQACMDSLAAGG